MIMMLKVMIVDDDESLVEVVKDILEEEGFEVIPASSGKMSCLVKFLRKHKEMRPNHCGK